MNSRLIITILTINYFLFGILLNSVGIVILQSINYFEVSKESAAVLEGFKDLPIAVVSFFVASFLPRLGYKNAMLVGLAVVSGACLLMATFPHFTTTKILFLLIGCSFALIKVSVYSTIGLLADNTKSHASLMNTIEGMFMVGVLSGYSLFGAFIDPSDPGSASWLNVFWLLFAICTVNLVVTFFTPMDESKNTPSASTTPAQDFSDMLKLIIRPLVYVFVASAFLYVLIEQGIGTWLPTFNNKVLHLPADMSVQITSIFAAGLALGRLTAGQILRFINWYPLLNICIIAMAVLVLISLPMSKGLDPSASYGGWFDLPLAAYIFPLIGLFMAPIYPAINSVVLSGLPVQRHAAMTGLIVIFSALGGTSGSLITGIVFSKFSGQTAFYLSLIPMGIILLLLYSLKNLNKINQARMDSENANERTVVS